MADLPAPTFPQALGDTIPIESVTAIDGVLVNIPGFPGLGINDLITLFWNGIAVGFYRVTTAIPQFPIQFVVPSTLATIGSYLVYYTADDFANAVRSSAIVNLQITLSGPVPIGQLRMILSTNASNYDWPAINVSPFNRGVVTGVPGTPVMVTVGSPGLIGESGRNYYLMDLGLNGQLDFSIFSEEQGLLTVNAYSVLDPANSVILTTFIGPYRLGGGSIKSVNYSTGAPANGRTYNSIYLKTEALSSVPGRPITFVRAIISTGSARIVGYPGSLADIVLNGDQSATINLTNMVSERTVVELSLPEQSGSEKLVESIFVQPSS
ncbi:hypothetical protein [Acerihabitans arboris]|uniref:Uncharacterized protein n=1 Tax=Acerihabitans arboris TaxID=2691583 RepID=A0A845SF92_9GAMM|nr:hypothetical protein [Acerihabitans arboris]NDL63683.1 hypothetical protein [Acerihabitans arboris]